MMRTRRLSMLHRSALSLLVLAPVAGFTGLALDGPTTAGAAPQGAAVGVQAPRTAGTSAATTRTIHVQANLRVGEELDLAAPGRSVGDQFVFSGDLLSTQTPDRVVGRTGGYCVITDLERNAGQCSMTAVLREGQITVQGEQVGIPTPGTVTKAVTGGTGKFRGARGQMEQRVLTPATWDLTFRLTASPGPAHQPARPGDVDGDGRTDEVRVSGDQVIVTATSAGRLTTTVPHDDPMQVAAVIDADGDGYADVWVRVLSGASTEFYALVRYDGDRLDVVTLDGRPYRAALGGTVTHSDEVSCDQAGRLYARSGDSTDGLTYRGERVTYRFAGSTLVRHSAQSDEWTAEGPGLPGLPNCGIR